MSKIDFQDVELICEVGCGKSFVWTSGEQDFMADLLEKGKIVKVTTPKRCSPCRKKAKERRDQMI